MAIRNLVSSSYHYSSESYSSGLNWSLEDESENKSAADIAVLEAESEIGGAEHAENAADAMIGVLEVARDNDGEMTENEASLVDDVNTAVSGGITDPEEAPIVISSESNGRLRISKEGIVDKIKEIWQRIKQAIMRVWSKLKDAYKKYFGVYKNMIKRAEKIKKRADDMSGKTIDEKVIEYTNNVSMLYLGGDKITNVELLLTGLEAGSKACDMRAIHEMIKIGDSYIDIISEYDASQDKKIKKENWKKIGVSYNSLISTGSSANNGVFPYLGGKKVYVDGPNDLVLSNINHEGSESDLIKFKIRFDDFSDKALPDSVNFTTMKTNDVAKVCDKVIELCKNLITISSSSGIDKLETKKEKLKEASDRLDKRHQQYLKDDKSHEAVSKGYSNILKLNTAYAAVITTYTNMVSTTGNYANTCLILCARSLDNYRTK